MAFEQVRNVIDRARMFHLEIADFYKQLEDRVDKEKVQIILEYLSRHERVLEQHLKQFEDDADRNVLDTWFKYAPSDEIRKTIEELVIRPDMSPADVVEMALKLDDTMLHLYKHAADVAAVDEVKDVFMNLYDEGRRARENMVLAVFGF